MTTIKSDSKLDSTRSWVEHHRVGNLIKPALLVRVATDSNYLSHGHVRFAAYGNHKVNGKVLMNVTSPGMRVPGIITWSTNESIDSLVQTGQMEIINALPISQTSTTLTGVGNVLPKRYFNPTIDFQVVRNSLGVPKVLKGDRKVDTHIDGSNITNTRNPHFREENLEYRILEAETITCADLSNFPNPCVPAEEMYDELQSHSLTPDANKGTYWRGSVDGGGAYYILIDEEVIRVTDWNLGTNTFIIPPGGRGQNNLIQDHYAGAKVTLLGFAPYVGTYTAVNYLTPNAFVPYQAALRAGTGLVSYEGYGELAGNMSKTGGDNYDFTGYWFTKRSQAALSDDGRPLITFDLQGAGYPITQQKISNELMQSARTTFGSWAKGEFDKSGYGRSLHGDWYDFHKWDPTLPNAYPFKIKTELAQNKAFFDHMRESQNGVQCEVCQREWVEAIRKFKNPNAIEVAQAVGKHIFRESVRVFNDCPPMAAGPIKTFLRLMAALAIGAWEHNVDGTPLAQRWTKMPTQLFTNLLSFNEGRVWSAQLAFAPPHEKIKDIHYDNQTRDDQVVVGRKLAITCPFEVEYDNQPFSQPMQDFADINNMTLFITRDGYIAFIPKGLSLKGMNAKGGKGEWHMAQGYSIDGYTHDIDPDSIVTNVVVTASTAFNVDISLTSGGTGFNLPNNKLVWYSGKVGNKEGLELTGGVMQTDTVSLDNVVLGFDWYINTKNMPYGLSIVRDGHKTEFYKLPRLPNGQPPLKRNDAHTKSHQDEVKRVQDFIAFLLIRHDIQARKNINPHFNKQEYGIKPTGKYDETTEQYVKDIQNWLIGLQPSLEPTGLSSITSNVALKATGEWDQVTYYWAHRWAKRFGDFIKTDVWWWTMNGLDWDQYVAHITGIPIPQNKSKSDQTAGAQWAIDQLALKQTQEDVSKKFHFQMMNYGNVVVDDSINKATIRTITSNMADPRVQIGDIIWMEIEGLFSATNILAQKRPPFANGMYVSSITRTMDLQQGSYTATYTGYRYRGKYGRTHLVNPHNYYDAK